MAFAPVYLDWNATAPLLPEARDAMMAAFDAGGNPSSVHREGRAARALVENARADVAQLVNGYAEVAHNYRRDHKLNMWFVLGTERPERIDRLIAEIEALTGLEVLNLPKLEEYFLELKLTA